MITEKPVSDRDIMRLEEGVDIGDDRPTLPAKASVMDDGLHLIITEGRFHQVKRMLEAVDNKVTYLKRLRMGRVFLDETLGSGEYRRLTESEVESLRSGNSL